MAAAAATVAWGAASCTPEPMAPVGVSPPRPVERAPRAEVDAAASLTPPDVAGESMEPITAPFMSSGHGERFDVAMWANAEARAAIQAGGPWIEGAVLAEQATSREAAGPAPAGWLVMRKNESGWVFSAVGPAGEAASETGIEACRTCHGGAPDGVFRWGDAGGP